MSIKKITAKRLCRAGVIAALYAVLTYVFAPFAFGPFQIRPAEALCILPLFFPEAVPAVWIGCMLSNLASPFFLWDVFVGGLVTLVAAIGTYLVGRFFKKDNLKILFGGMFPVVLNTLIIPLIIVFLSGDLGSSGGGMVYLSIAFWIFLSECIWVYGLGSPLYFLMKKVLSKK